MSELFAGSRAAEPMEAPESKPVETQGGSESGRIVVYGRAGCAACVNAVQDLIDRQVSFSYFDVTRDASAMQHVQAICGGTAVVPVIVQIGFRGEV